MHSIATLTVNPALDKNTTVDIVAAEEKLSCTRPTREPGGGGLNVSRAIQRLDGRSTAFYTAGGPMGDVLQSLLSQEGIDHHPIATEDWTRENLIVFEKRSGRQFRFGMPGPRVSEPVWRKCLDLLRSTDSPPAFIVASGSLSDGMPSDFYTRVGEVARELGARYILDTPGDALKNGLGARTRTGSTSI